MKIKAGLTIISILAINLLANAQTKYTLSGFVKDSVTGEAIVGATLTTIENPTIGVTTNAYGFYSILLNCTSCTIKVSCIGYKTHEQNIAQSTNQKLDIFLVQKKKEIKEAIVVAKKRNNNLTTTQMGTVTLNMKEIAKMPVLFGEKDILKTIQLLPGVKSLGEGNSGFSVRGGSADQNLILLDEAPVYNASHLMGFFSTFNSDAIKDVTLIKGNSPANYGGRLASVLDVKMKEGSNKNYSASGGIGLISSRLTLEGPIQKEKSSFMLSGRRTYADLFLKFNPDFENNQLYFYDLNAKANYQINSKHKIYASGYFGRDILGLNDVIGIDWGNATGTIRWNYLISNKLFSNTSLIYSDYDYRIKLNTGDNDFNVNSSITDWNLKQDFSYYLNNKNTIKVGFNVIRHTIAPTTYVGTVDNSSIKANKNALEQALYFDNLWKVNDKLNIDYGIRFTAYSVLGGGTYYTYNNGVILDSITLKVGEIGKTYFNYEPRVNVNYRLRNDISLKAGYARNTQHLHLLSNTTSGNPTDQWIGNTYNIKPEISDQVSIGYYQNFNNNQYEIVAETYYKKMSNQVDFKNGADLQTEPDVESQLVFGKGRAYGLELMLKKKEGRFTGWLSYTLAKSERQINGINNNEWYNAKQDRTHDLSIVANYQFLPKWTISGIFVYYTGNAVTFPTGKYILNGNTIYQYGARNADRMPDYNRLDINFTKEFKTRKNRESSLSFGCYNVYGRENAYTITFRENADNPNSIEAVQTSLFRWVPSISYNFKF